MRGWVATDEGLRHVTDLPGHEEAWEPDPSFRRVYTTDRLCRRMGPGHVMCDSVAVAELDRAHSWDQAKGIHRWWAYCERHLYGRRIVDGVVEHRVLREVGP